MSFIGQVYRSANAGLAAMLPRPLDVLRSDLGLPALTQASLHLAQETWAIQWDRDPMPEFLIHDAMHYLLDAPPTPMGEAMVTAFQVRHQVFDDNVVGFLAIAIAGRVAIRRIPRAVREASERALMMPCRLDALRVAASGLSVVQ